MKNSFFSAVILSAALIASAKAYAVSKPWTWEDCLMQSSRNHPDLVSANEGIRQSEADARIKTAAFMPQASANLSVTEVKTHDHREASKSSTTTYAYGLSGTQLLFDGFKTANTFKASIENLKASQSNFQYVSSQVRLRLKTAFVQTLKAQELTKITQDIYNLRKYSVDLVNLRYNSGTEHKGALLTAKAKLAQADFEIHQADRNLEVAQRRLLKEVGAKADEPIEVSGDLKVTAVYEGRPDVEKLVLENPQLLKLTAKMNAAAFDVKAGTGNLWPSISLIGGVGKSDEVWPPKADSTNAGVKLTWPIFAGGQKLAELDQDKSLLRDLQAQQQSLKDALIVALEGAWVSLQDALEQLKVQEDFLIAAQERAKIARGQYAVGLISFDNWIIIEDDLVANKKTFLNTQANALLAEAAWIEAQGRTLEYEL